jgi:hypothetical protein
MRKLIQILAVSGLTLFLAAGSVFAFGTDITISDGNTATSYEAWAYRAYYRIDTSWYSDREDSETETGMQIGQAWDMEGFFLDEETDTLSMVGGYDLANGYGGTTAGDIFIDVDGDAEYGKIYNDVTGNEVVTDVFGYDYALDLDFQNFTYDVYALTEDSSTVMAYVDRNQGSNPWQYNDGGVLIAEDVDFTYQTGLTDAETGFAGGYHNAVTDIDLGFIASDVPTEFIVHFTMACGNDNLMGEGTLAAVENGGGGGGSAAPTPEPATMFLLGSGMVGLGSLRKRFAKKTKKD